MTTPLEILGLPEGSTKAEVKARYRALVQTQHPDVGGGVAEFLRTNQAYLEALAKAPERSICPTCGGIGSVGKIVGIIKVITICPTCGGAHA